MDFILSFVPQNAKLFSIKLGIYREYFVYLHNETNKTMITQFKSLIQLLDYFKEEETCINYLAQQRWGEIPCCPHCGNTKAWKTNRGYTCAAKECGKKFSVTTGTIFENTKLSLRIWFAAIYLCTAHKKGISSLQLSRDLNITQKTAWFMLHRIREMLGNNEPELLNGIVEIDETYVGGKEKNKHKSKQSKTTLGRGIDKAPVIAMVQRNGVVRAFATKGVNSDIIYNLIVKNIKKGSTMITDGFTSYNWVGRQYNHISVKHNDDFTTEGDNHTNSVEGFFSHFKRSILGIYHFASKKHLQAYCDEMTYRFSTRDIKDVQRFENSFIGCNTRLTYHKLIANG